MDNQSAGKFARVQEDGEDWAVAILWGLIIQLHHYKADAIRQRDKINSTVSALLQSERAKAFGDGYRKGREDRARAREEQK